MNPLNPNMIDSNTEYMNSSSDEVEIDDLDARIAKYSNIKSKPIGDFTDSDSEIFIEEDWAEDWVLIYLAPLRWDLQFLIYLYRQILHNFLSL